MKIPTLLFIIFLLNLASICVCKNSLEEGEVVEEGNISSAINIPQTNEQQLGGGESSGPSATGKIDNDFDDSVCKLEIYSVDGNSYGLWRVDDLWRRAFWRWTFSKILVIINILEDCGMW